MLSSNGLVIISATLNKKSKALLIRPDVVTRGFIYDKENEEILNEIKSTTIKVIEENTNNKYADYTKIRNDIRERVGAYLFKETDSKPVILIVIQEVEV
jgi:ribonuclease J